MKVSEIQIQNNIPEQKKKNNQCVTFSGKRDDVKKQAWDITQEFLKTQPWYVRLAYKFSDKKYQGDVANILITGAGTGIIAPVLISKNPMTKNEDKDTKTYAAWRQPVSAVIAVVTQVGINIQVRKIIQKLAAAGKLGEKLDTRVAKKLMVQVEEIKDKYSNEEVTKAAGKTVSEISKQIDSLKGRADEITSRVSKFRDLISIGIALATLPFACGLLNWVYPKFMNAFFPELSKKKQTKQHKNNDYNVIYAKEPSPKAGDKL